MFEYRWSLESPAAKHVVRLQILARNGWIGRKRLFVDDRPLFSRRWFGGINQRFDHPGDPTKRVELRAMHDPTSGAWMPQLTCDGVVVPEETGMKPPPVPDRPASIAVVTGVTYLIMLMALVMLGHIWKMLDAGLGHSDSRALVLAVEGRGSDDGLSLQRELLPWATVGKPYETTIAVEGGTPPWQLTRTQGRMPKGLTFDGATGEIQGTPAVAGDTILGVRVTDTEGASAHWSYVLAVKPESEAEPRVVTSRLKPAREGQEYTAELEVVGGQPPYHWVVNDRKLPRGLKLRCDPYTQEDRGARTTLSGTPEPNFEGKINEINSAAREIVINGTTVRIHEHTILRREAKTATFDDLRVGDVVSVSGVTDGAYPARFRVYDSTYSPAEDVSGWIVPFGATALCLLGFWNMRRWSVILYGVLLLGQIIAPSLMGSWFPQSSVLALILQGLIFCVAVVRFGRMR